MKNRHLNSKERLLYLLNDLPVRKKEALSRHLQGCSSCRARLEAEKPLLNLFMETGRPEPESFLLERSRSRLMNQVTGKLDVRIPAEGKRRFRRGIPSLRTPVLLAGVSAVFLLGLFAGRVIERGAAARDRIFEVLNSSLPVGRLQILPGDKQEVAIRFYTVEEKQLKGSLKDPEIRYALTYALLNDPSDKVRLKTAGLLSDAVDDPDVYQAMMQALEEDTNPGVRLKAIRALNQTPMNEKLQNTFVNVLFRETNTGVRVEAGNALQKAEDPRIRPILQKIAEEDLYIRALMRKAGTIDVVSEDKLSEI
jgi:hypothetical protein